VELQSLPDGARFRQERGFGYPARRGRLVEKCAGSAVVEWDAEPRAREFVDRHGNKKSFQDSGRETSRVAPEAPVVPEGGAGGWLGDSIKDYSRDGWLENAYRELAGAFDEDKGQAARGGVGRPGAEPVAPRGGRRLGMRAGTPSRPGAAKRRKA